MEFQMRREEGVVAGVLEVAGRSGCGQCGAARWCVSRRWRAVRWRTAVVAVGEEGVVVGGAVVAIGGYFVCVDEVF
jgi:positive regulator of sigma E activity